MRIVHLTQSTTAEVTGGLEYHIKYLSAALHTLGHEVIVVNTSAFKQPICPRAAALSTGRALGQLLPLNFVGHRLNSLYETAVMFGRRYSTYRYSALVAERVNRLKPDLVHQHSYIGELRTCRLLAKKYPIVFTNHTGAYLHLERWALTRHLQRNWMKRFSMIIGPSRELTPCLETCRYVPNGVDTATFYPRSYLEREFLKTKYQFLGKKVFLSPRRWAPTKGIIYMAKALRHLPKAVRESSVFLFAGNETPGYNRYQRHVREELAASGCETYVLGNVESCELAGLMNISEACVFPSLMEATSLACLEAMACATPIIGTRTGGLLELIQEGENGWLVPTHNEKSLAAQIYHVSRIDPEDLDRIGQNASEMVRKHYTWAITAKRTEKIYYEALQRWHANLIEYPALVQNGLG